MIDKKKREKLLNLYGEIMVKNGILRAIKLHSLMSYLDFLFQDVSVVGKSMLDVGSGSGLHSFYAAIMGAKRVVCLEPEAEGSNEGVLKRFGQVSARLSLDNVQLKPITFQEFDADNQRFDIILLFNSINHLDEEACSRLKGEVWARRRYDSIFLKLSELAAPDAKLIIADCSSNNLFVSLGIRNPLVPTIEWRKHQPPELWSSMLSKHEFGNPRIRWNPLHTLRNIGKPLRSKVVSFLLTSHFLIVMDKIHGVNHRTIISSSDEHAHYMPSQYSL